MCVACNRARFPATWPRVFCELKIMKMVILIHQIIQEKLANGDFFMLVMIGYILGMFMKILNFCVFNKMVSDRKILWFPSKWGVNHLKRWRNGEVVGKKRIMNYSQKLWPGTAMPIDLYTILCVKAHFFTTKEHLTKMHFCFLKFGCY